MKEKTKAYAAGILDAEGCISLRKQIRGNIMNYAASVIVQTTDEPLSKWFVHHFGGVVRFRQANNIKHKDSFRWEIHNAQHASKFLSLILPYLTVKKAEAQCLLDYFAMNGQRDPATRETLFNKVKNLKEQSSVTTDTPSFPEKTNLFNAYVSGLFDGEGSVQIGKASRNGRPRFIPRITIFNTVFSLLKPLQQQYGGAFTKHPQREENHLPLFSWQLTDLTNIENFILCTLPYTIIKRDRQKLLLSFVRMRRQKEPEIRNDLFLALKKLNVRGKMIQSELHE